MPTFLVVSKIKKNNNQILNSRNLKKKKQAALLQSLDGFLLSFFDVHVALQLFERREQRQNGELLKLVKSMVWDFFLYKWYLNIGFYFCGFLWFSIGFLLVFYWFSIGFLLVFLWMF